MTPTARGSLPFRIRPCQALQAAARASATASSRSCRRRRRKAYRAAFSTADRWAVNCCWACVNDNADMGDLLGEGDRPRCRGRSRCGTVPGGHRHSYMTGYCCIFSIRPPPAALAGDAGRGDHAERGPAGRLRRGGEREFLTPRIEPELARRPGHSSASVVHRVRIRRHPARDEADASWDPRHRRLRWRRPRFPDEGPPPAPDRSIVGRPEVAVMRVALVNAPLLSAVCDHGVGHQMPPGSQGDRGVRSETVWH